MKVVFKIFGGLFAFIFCIVLLVVELGAHTVIFSSNVVSENGINRFVDSIDVSLLLEDSDGNKTAVYDKLANTFEKMGLEKNATERILKSDEFTNVISQVLNSAAEYYVLGKTDLFMTNEKIDSLVDENIDGVLVASGMNIQDNYKTKLVSEVKTTLYEIFKSPTTRENLIGEENLRILNFILSDTLKIALGVAILVLTLLIALVKWSIGKAIRDNGIVTIIVASFILIMGLIFGYAFTLIAGRLPSITDYVSVLTPVLRYFGNILLINGMVALVVGILLLLIAKLIKRKKADREDGKALQAL